MSVLFTQRQSPYSLLVKKILIFKVFELLANFFLLVPGPCLSTFFIIKGVLDRSNIGRRENGKPWLSILKGGNT